MALLRENSVINRLPSSVIPQKRRESGFSNLALFQIFAHSAYIQNLVVPVRARGQPDSRTSCTFLFLGISALKLKSQKKSYGLFGLFGFSAQRSNLRSFKFRGFIFTFFLIPAMKKSEKILPKGVSPLSRSRSLESDSFPTRCGITG